MYDHVQTSWKNKEILLSQETCHISNSILQQNNYEFITLLYMVIFRRLHQCLAITMSIL